MLFCFFFSSRRRHTRCLSDWSSDVCSSDLALAVDETNNPTCRLGAARAEARCGKRCREHEYFEPSKHDVAPLKEIRVCRSGKVPAPTPGATRESQRGCRAAADFSFAAVTER